MNPELTLPLSVGEIVALCGVIWGLAKMSKSVDVLSEVTTKLTERMDYFGMSLNDMVGRVRVLEDRRKRS